MIDVVVKTMTIADRNRLDEISLNHTQDEPLCAGARACVCTRARASGPERFNYNKRPWLIIILGAAPTKTVFCLHIILYIPDTYTHTHTSPQRRFYYTRSSG